jgi:DNA repair protein RecO (recombination protein O)
MAEYSKTMAIVLRTTDYSESSQILTLWSEEHGKLRAIAKGARRSPKSGGAGMDLLNVCEIVFVHKAPPALSIITSWQVVESFSSLRQDLNQLYAGLYAAELVNHSTEEGHPDQETFRLLCSFLRALSCGKPRYPGLLRFELLLLENFGIGPRVDGCATCGKPLGPGAAFCAASGGALCESCEIGGSDLLRVSLTVLRAMQRLARRDRADGVAEISGETIGEIRYILDKYLSYHLGRQIGMRAYVTPSQAPAVVRSVAVSGQEN